MNMLPFPNNGYIGHRVQKMYFPSKDIDRITTYSEKNVKAIAQLILSLIKVSFSSEEEVLHV